MHKRLFNGIPATNVFYPTLSIKMDFWRASNPYLQEKVETEVNPTVVGPGAPTAGGAESPTTVRGKKPPGHPKKKTHGEDKARAEARTGQPFIHKVN
jgi:hypothetical protein